MGNMVVITHTHTHTHFATAAPPSPPSLPPIKVPHHRIPEFHALFITES